ncbi:MAG: DNA primase [Bacteroidota bacterium]
MISEQDKQRVLMASDIVEVIESFVPLKKAGQNYKGLCPFHNEKTPSFTVSPQKQIFHCFGCQESGGVISFMMKHEHLSYPEAVKALAERYNIEIEEERYSPEQQAEKNKADSYAGILKMASNWFKEQLHQSEKGKAIGQSYIQERGISPEMTEKFEMGYCPPEGREFANYAISKGYSKEFLEELGLIKENERGVYDIYRGRLIFPISELGGKIIAFGARALRKDQQPKYINSPEHLIYNKSRTLYALNEARKSISQKDNVYIVEGYTDVIALHQSGILNTVATCGTSVTEDHISRLRHMSKNVTLLFDGDAAGQKAALRTIKIVLKAGLNPKVVALPEGEDPDSLTKKFSAFDLQNFLEDNAKDFLYYLHQSQFVTAAHDPIKKAAASKVIMEAIAEIQDEVKKAFYIQDCANLLSISEEAIVSEISKFRIKASYQNRSERQVVEQLVAMPQPSQQEQKIDVQDSEGQEEDILRVLLVHGNRTYEYEGILEGEKVQTACSYGAFIFEEVGFNGIEFQNHSYAKCYTAIEKQFQLEGKIDPLKLTQLEDQEVVSCISKILSKDIQISNNWTDKFNIHISTEEDRPDLMMISALNKLKIKSVFKYRARLIHALAEATSENDQELILKKIQKLDAIKAELSNYFGISIY